MAHIPERVKDLAIISSLKGGLLGQGKVRETYAVPGLDEVLIHVASDRVSIFDFVLPFTIPRKGEVLTALTHWWLTGPLAAFPNHLLPFSNEGVRFLAKHLKNIHHDIPLGRTLFVRRAETIKLEFVYRMMLGGSVYKAYTENGVVAGVELPKGFPKWSKLDEPLFTPTTKAQAGHDKPMTQTEAYKFLGTQAVEMVALGRRAYKVAYKQVADRGWVLLDTKLELGFITVAGKKVLALIDEVFTPDSSRLTSSAEWKAGLAAGKDPVAHDKQYVREWGTKIKTPFKDSHGKQIVGLNHNELSTENPEHLAFVDSLEAPEELIARTSEIYLDIMPSQVGVSLDDYQAEYLLL